MHAGSFCFFLMKSSLLCLFLASSSTILVSFYPGPRGAQSSMWSQCSSSWKSLMFSWRNFSTRGRSDWMFTCNSASCTSARWRCYFFFLNRFSFDSKLCSLLPSCFKGNRGNGCLEAGPPETVPGHRKAGIPKTSRYKPGQASTVTVAANRGEP